MTLTTIWDPLPGSIVEHVDDKHHAGREVCLFSGSCKKQPQKIKEGGKLKPYKQNQRYSSRGQSMKKWQKTNFYSSYSFKYHEDLHW